MSLRFGEAHLQLAKLKLEDPNNLVVHHIENYIDFFRLYITEDKALYKQLEANKDRRLSAIETGDESSPYYLFLQADIRLHWALVSLRFEDYLPAFTDVNRANKLLEKNQERFPDFIPNLKDLAILHAMVGTIPDGYQWSVRLLSSLKGTIDQGKKEMEKVVSYARQHDDFLFTKESQVLQAYLLLHLANEPQQAWKTIRKSELVPADNPLHAFVVANIAMRTGHNDEAIRILEAAPQDGIFHPLPFLEFMLGLAKLRRLDRDAGKHFDRFVEKFNGTHYIKEAYQKLAWQALINGDPTGYRTNLVQVSQRGNATSGGDSNAQREADAGRTPHVDLVRARLLFDGGYAQKAYDRLAPLKLNESKDAYLRLEYTYRMGRILQELDRTAEAISYFEKTIEDSGANSPYFFACNAALQCGLIYEKIESWQKAKEYFKKCLLLNPDEYATGLHQRAKAGLARIRKR
ncbi:hypothetical protein CRP01_28600 [Flavilitoribacter nigricans DSM 23189 = NBRC 102662]|uniref:Uncharacterized protein n=2 Tax=Flavilitoribacter TaxID=2762562 RepID=A0A2D0N3M3_FLAN2|nr:hypothetical protein CRP01_28600 [Flavilitoribacter nigricans DSM 23189 = NBRC 102662]